MAASLLTTLKESARQQANEDFNFYAKMIYFFELAVPSSISATGSFLFPLMLNPQSITLEEPFSLETTLTSDGGVYCEENGIVIRKIHIRGNTGFKPRPLPGGIAALPTLISEQKSFDRTLPTSVVDAISGQRHFQYLQDAVFRTYGDLKKDPTTSKDTHLYWHNPKDNEHFEVKPENFSLIRSNVMYEYSIDLLVVGKASASEIGISEDKTLLDSLKDALRQVNNTIQLLQGGVRDLTNMVNDIKTTVSGVETILNNAIGIISACTDFVNRTASLIQLPRKIVSDVITGCDNAFQDMEDAVLALVAGGTVVEDPVTHTTPMPLPIQVYQALESISLGCSLLLLNPASFETPLEQKLRELKEKQALSTSVTSEDLELARLAQGLTKSADINNIGTGLMPGDYNRSNVDITESGASIPGYTSLQEIEVKSGDTLSSLAAQYIGDARKWSEIAIINNMKPPYISNQAASDITEATDEEAFPGAFGVGKKLLIPTYKIPPQSRPLLPVIGVPTDQPAEIQILGSDLMLYKLPGTVPLYDIKINTDIGSTDACIVQGIDNLQQAVEQRIVVEQGTNIMYKKFGIEDIIGLKWLPVDAELVKFRVMKSLLSDPRIGSVQDFKISSSSGDDVVIDTTLSILGLSQQATIKNSL